MAGVRPSERYEVHLNLDSGRTHLWDRLATSGKEPGEYVCVATGRTRDVLWPMDNRHGVDNLGPVDDHMLGSPTWGGQCRGCFEEAWKAHLAEVVKTAREGS